MNAANVIPLNTPHAVTYAKSGHPAGLNPLRVRFDAFELDEPNALLLRGGKTVTLAPRPFGVLCALARRPGSLLTKHALLDDVWGHQFVTDSVLKTAISEIRAALGDDPKQPHYIETVSRRGYRFIAAAEGYLRTRPRRAQWRRSGPAIPLWQHSRHCAAATPRSPTSSVRSPLRSKASGLFSTIPAWSPSHENLRATSERNK